MDTIDLESTRAALRHISSATDRQSWVKTAMAIKSQFPGDEGLSLFHEWSSSSPSQYNKRATDATWRSIKSGGGVTIATLIHDAQSNGWTGPTARKPNMNVRSSPITVSPITPRNDNVAVDATDQAAYAATQATELLASAKAGAPAAYLARKNVGSHGTYTTPSGVLLVPMVDHDGQLKNVQRILPQRPDDGPDKLYLKGGQKSGLFHVIGNPSEAKVILFAEGYATGASLHEATGYPVVVTFDSGNLPKVAASWRERLPSATFVICGDDDHSNTKNAGREKALEAAALARAHIAFPSDGPEPLQGTDFNDLAKQAQSYAPIALIIDKALATAPAKAPTTEPLVTNTPGKQDLASEPTPVEASAAPAPSSVPTESQKPGTSIESPKATQSKPPPTPQQAAAAAQALWSQGTGETPSPVMLAHHIEQTYGSATTSNGVLLVPMRDAQGIVQNVQRIMPDLSSDGTSRAYYVKGASKDGLTHVLGSTQGAQLTVVTKDFVSAASIHKATALPVVVTFTEKAYEATIKALQASNPESQIVLAGVDDRAGGAKQANYAKGVADITGARLALVGDFRPVDFSGQTFEQLHLQQGDQAIRDVFRTLPIKKQSNQAEIQPPPVPTDAQDPYQNDSPIGQLERDPADIQEPPLAQAVNAFDELKSMYDTDAKGGFYFKATDKKLAFQDSGAKIHTPHDDADTARSMLKLAKAKGWRVVKLQGTEDFVRNAWMEAQLLGIETKGYKPDQYDLDKLSDRRALNAADQQPPVGNSVSQVNDPSPVIAQKTDPNKNTNARADLSVPAQPVPQETRPSTPDKTQKSHQAILANVQAHLEGHGIVASEISNAKAYVSNFLRNERAHFGKVLDHGAEHYEFDPSKKINYFVKIETPRGQEKIIWGVDLERGMTSDQSPRVGETVVIAYQGEKQVRVTDEAGKWVDTHRNEWFVKNISQIHFDGNNPAAVAALSSTAIVGDAPTVHPLVGTQASHSIRVLARALQIKETPPTIANKALAAVQQPAGVKVLAHGPQPQFTPVKTTPVVAPRPSL